MLMVARAYAARAIRLVKSLLPRPMSATVKLLGGKAGVCVWVCVCVCVCVSE